MPDVRRRRHTPHNGSLAPGSPLARLPLGGYEQLAHNRMELAIARQSPGELDAAVEDLKRRWAAGDPPITRATHLAELVGPNPPDALLKLHAAVEEVIRPGATLGDLLAIPPVELALLPNCGTVAPWCLVQALIAKLEEC